MSRITECMALLVSLLSPSLAAAQAQEQRNHISSSGCTVASTSPSQNRGTWRGQPTVQPVRRFTRRPPVDPGGPAIADGFTPSHEHQGDPAVGQESAQAFGFGVGSNAAVPLGAFPVPAPAVVQRSLPAPASRRSLVEASPPLAPTPGGGQPCQGLRGRRGFRR